MAAGLGFKTFATGEVLSAANVNGYLMQGILVFATEAVRNAAITVPAEGQFAFTKDNNTTWFYDGAAWVVSGGGISPSIVDAKGDLIAATADNAVSRLAVGANNTVLTADNTTATGLKWTDSTIVRLAQTILTSAAADITFSSISGAYKNLRLVFQMRTGAGNNEIGVQFNGDTGANYDWQFFRALNATLQSSEIINDTKTVFAQASVGTGSVSANGLMTIPNYSGTTLGKGFVSNYMYRNGTGTGTIFVGTNGGSWRNIAAITSIKCFGSANLEPGTIITLYGEA